MSRKAVWVALVTVGVAAGCATGTGTSAPSGELSAEDCVSGEGQRFLTYCASPDAADLARRQYTIARAADETVSAQDMVPLPVEGAPLRGAADGATTIHLFSDLWCGECVAMYRALAERVDGAPGQLRLVFRHVPSDEVGEVLSRAVIAAAEQGRFWELADAIVAAEEELDLGRLVEATGLELERWERDFGRDRVEATLVRDRRLAQEVGVVAGPTAFVNGRRVVGAVSAKELDEIFEAEARQVRAMEAAGLRGTEISWRRILQNYRSVNWRAVEALEAEIEEALRVKYVPADPGQRFGADGEEVLVTAVLFVGEDSYSAVAERTWQELVGRYGEAGLQLVLRAADGAVVELAPTVYVNGIELVGVWSVEELEPLVEDQLLLGETLRELTGQSGEALYRNLVEVNAGE